MSNSPKHKARRMERAKKMKALSRAGKPTPSIEKAHKERNEIPSQPADVAQAIARKLGLGL
jgi:hypothetical protein